MIQKIIDLIAVVVIVVGLAVGSILIVRPHLLDDSRGPTTATDLPPGEFSLSSGDFWTLTREGHWLGPEGAEVVLIVFASYQCAFSRRLHHTLAELRARYPDHVAVVIRQFAVASGSAGYRTRLALECAGAQGQFEPYHDAVFANPHVMSYSEGWLDFADSARIDDLTMFRECVRSGRYVSRIEADEEEARRLGVMASPTTFVNGERIVGAAPLEVPDSLVASHIRDPR